MRHRQYAIFAPLDAVSLAAIRSPEVARFRGNIAGLSAVQQPLTEALRFSIARRRRPIVATQRYSAARSGMSIAIVPRDLYAVLWYLMKMHMRNMHMRAHGGRSQA